MTHPARWITDSDEDWRMTVDIRDLVTIDQMLVGLEPTYDAHEMSALMHLRDRLGQHRVDVLLTRASRMDPADVCSGCGMTLKLGADEPHSVSEREVELFTARYPDTDGSELMEGSYHAYCCPWCALSLEEVTTGDSGGDKG